MSSHNLLFAPSNNGTQFGISPRRTFRIGGSYEHWMRADELREAAVNVRSWPLAALNLVVLAVSERLLSGKGDIQSETSEN